MFIAGDETESDNHKPQLEGLTLDRSSSWASEGGAIGALLAMRQSDASSTRNGVLKSHGARSARFAWTDDLRRRFALVVSDLGGAHVATPGSILKHMVDVEGLTRSKVASYLQKYREKLRLRSRTVDDHPEEPGENLGLGVVVFKGLSSDDKLNDVQDEEHVEVKGYDGRISRSSGDAENEIVRGSEEFSGEEGGERQDKMNNADAVIGGGVNRTFAKQSRSSSSALNNGHAEEIEPMKMDIDVGEENNRSHEADALKSTERDMALLMQENKSLKEENTLLREQNAMLLEKIQTQPKMEEAFC